MGAASDPRHPASGSSTSRLSLYGTFSFVSTIVTSINVELARDGKLQPIKIDVEATRGRVALRGTAPDAESVARATTIASAVKGVTGVDNYLTISKS